MRKGNCEDAVERFPTNGIKYETKNLNNFRESLSNAELQREVKRLRELIAKSEMERETRASKASQHLAPKPSCMV